MLLVIYQQSNKSSSSASSNTGRSPRIPGTSGTPGPTKGIPGTVGTRNFGHNKITNEKVLGPIFPDLAPVAQTFEDQPSAGYEHRSWYELLYDCFEEAPFHDYLEEHSSATGSANQAECKQQ